MTVRLIDVEKLFKRVISDPEDKLVKRFREVLGELAKKAGGRVTGFELTDKQIRVSFGSKEVADKVSSALKSRSVIVEEVNLADEFFDELNATV